jgi:hypothetical protein
MSARASWQTLLADLALVLFIITAAALTRQRPAHHALPAMPFVLEAAPANTSPLAIYRDAPGAPPLADWLRQQSHDPRQQITIVARYAPGSENALPRRVAALVAAAVAAGAHPRIVIEPGDGSTSAGVGYDAPADVAPAGRDLLPLDHEDQTLQTRTARP